MLNLTLALATLFPQDAQVGQGLSTLGIPAENCFSAVEVVSRTQLLQEAGALPLLAIWRHPKLDGILRFGAQADASWKSFYDHREALLAWIDRFDVGMAGAVMFTEGYNDRPSDRIFFVGNASTGARLRGYESAIIDLVSSTRAKSKLKAPERKLLALPDRPIAVSAWKASRDRARGASMHNMHYYLRKGRRAAWHGGYLFLFQKDYAERYDKGVTKMLGSLVDTRRGTANAMDIAEAAPIEGEVLARAVLRFADNAADPEHGIRRRGTQRTKSVGFWLWDGLTSRLVKGPDGLREVVDSFETRVEGDSPFHYFRGDDYGLGDVATCLPKNTLAAIRIAFDAEMATRWASAVGRELRSGEEFESFFDSLRETLELKPRAAEHGLAGIGEITLALLPPAPGALVPEPCFLLRSTSDAGLALRAMQKLAPLLNLAAQSKLRVKTLGKGEDAIPYISLKGLMPASSRGGMVSTPESMGIKALLGGGYLSATRVGDYLAIGCNPKTIRKVKRSAKSGATLATREGFAESFPAASGRFFEAWFDWKGIVRSARLLDQLAPMITMISPRKASNSANEAKKMEALVLPTTKELAELVGEQRILGTKNKLGHRIIFEGSLVVSPLPISTWVLAYELYENAMHLTRK